MSMTEWARNEVELACKRENPNWDGKSFDYGCACYQSALKAYEVLMQDGHSGMSFGFTKNILIRLMEDYPLSPITDEDFYGAEFQDSKEYLQERGLKSDIQCARLSSLFRIETIKGKVFYRDVNRAYGVEISNPNSAYTSGAIDAIVDDMFPITMPYIPTNNRYKVYTDTFLVDEKNGDYDTRAFLYMITPKGERVDIDRYQREMNGQWVNITEEEYYQLKANRIDK